MAQKSGDVWTRWVIGAFMMILVGAFSFWATQIVHKVDAAQYLSDLNSIEERIQKIELTSDKKVDKLNEKIDCLQKGMTQVLIKLGQIEVRMEQSKDGKND
jgi:hypothetical protein